MFAGLMATVGRSRSDSHTNVDWERTHVVDLAVDPSLAARLFLEVDGGHGHPGREDMARVLGEEAEVGQLRHWRPGRDHGEEA